MGEAAVARDRHAARLLISEILLKGGYMSVTAEGAKLRHAGFAANRPPFDRVRRITASRQFTPTLHARQMPTKSGLSK